MDNNLLIKERLGVLLLHEINSRESNIPTMNFLLQNGADVEYHSSQNYDSGMLNGVFRTNNYEIFNLLLRYKISANSNNVHTSYIRSAIRSNVSLSIFDLLIKFTLRLNSFDSVKLLAFDEYFNFADNGMAYLYILLHYECDINKQDQYGKKPLYHAVLNKNKELVQALIINGAEECDCTIVDRHGKAPKKYMIKFEQTTRNTFNKLHSTDHDRATFIKDNIRQQYNQLDIIHNKQNITI